LDLDEGFKTCNPEPIGKWQKRRQLLKEIEVIDWNYGLIMETVK